MDLTNHSMSALFAQLGLKNEEADIQAFVASHGPLPGDQRLADAPFWNEAQARFLSDEVREDADWADVVDQLNLMLHE
ncbi:MAG: DUF2789 domain-containing protein [Burkholderiaceae bacterium]